MISVCMIAKNEAEFIKAAIESALPYSRDVVVVDTGSDDGTTEMARAMGARVCAFKWSDDFSAARNYCAGLAEHDWILTLDADEEIVMWDETSVKRALERPDTVGQIELIDCDGIEEAKRGKRLSRIYHRGHYKYDGIVHEQLVAAAGAAKHSGVAVTLNHYGYQPRVIRARDKNRRNRELLLKALGSDKNDPYLLYQLGRNYLNAAQADDAIASFEKALAQNPDTRLEYAADLVLCYGNALLGLGQYQKALALEKYARGGAGGAYRFMMGNVYMNNAQFAKAVEWFSGCVKEGDALDDTGRMACYNIGVILECLGKAGEAAGYYRRCGDYAPAARRLAALNAGG